MPPNITTRKALNSQCLLQIQTLYTFNAISVLKPYTHIETISVPHSTVWHASKSWTSLSPLGAYMLRRLILTR